MAQTNKEKAAIKRLRYFMQNNKLLLAKIGAYRNEDRFISTLTFAPSGATVSNKEYNSILLDIVRTVCR